MSKQMIIVAGDCGVYVGLAEGGVAAVSDAGAVTLTRSRHLRRYRVAGCAGDGSAGDLAALGLDPSSPSVSVVVEGEMRLLGVRRAFVVAPSVAASFGVE